MKSSNEIKKGLECCVDGNIVCAGNCVFDDDVKLGYPDCVKLLMTNALALIQQLQAENDRLTDEVCNAYNVQNEQLVRINQLEAERDALMHDIEEYFAECALCKHYTQGPYETPCNSCKHMHTDAVVSMWEWRGVQKEE